MKKTTVRIAVLVDTPDGDCSSAPMVLTLDTQARSSDVARAVRDAIAESVRPVLSSLAG